MTDPVPNNPSPSRSVQFGKVMAQQIKLGRCETAECYVDSYIATAKGFGNPVGLAMGKVAKLVLNWIRGK